MRVICALVVLLWVTTASARDARVAIVVGANQGDELDPALRYAEADAERMRGVLTNLGDARVQLVRGTVADVRSALRDAAVRVTFVFYYSGHGDQDSLHLTRARLPLAELRGLVMAVPAEVRVVVLDACRGLGRLKGVSASAPFQLSAVARGPRGSVEIRASSEGEAAQESDDLRGSVFTHFLLSGLRGDADADGDHRVTMAELYAYTYRRTLLRTQRGPVAQHATMDIDLAGAGELILSTQAASRIAVPAGGASYLVITLPSAGVLGEVSGGGMLAVPAGRYLVVVRDGERTRAAEVDLGGGGAARLEASDFHEVRREDLVARGGLLELRRSRLRVAAGMIAAPAGGPERPAGHVRVGFGRMHGPLWWELDVGAALGNVRDELWAGTARTFSLGALAGWRARTTSYELGVGAGPEVSWGREEVHRPLPLHSGAARDHALVGYGAAGVRLEVRVAAALGPRSTLSFELGVLAMLRREATMDGLDHQLAGHFMLVPMIGYGWSF